MLYRNPESPGDTMQLHRDIYDLFTCAVPLLIISHLTKALPSELFEENELTSAEIVNILKIQAVSIVGAIIGKSYGLTMVFSHLQYVQGVLRPSADGVEGSLVDGFKKAKMYL
jgi:hypothetical protein